MVAKELLKAAPDVFTGGVNYTLEKIVFTEQVWTTCVPAWRQMCSLCMRLLNAEEIGQAAISVLNLSSLRNKEGKFLEWTHRPVPDRVSAFSVNLRLVFQHQVAAWRFHMLEAARVPEQVHLGIGP